MGTEPEATPQSLDPSLSRDAAFSTYAPYAPGPEDDPLAGPAVVQTLGVPSEIPLGG